jgi:uncharacterized protein (TIGR02996 family)
MAAIGRGTTIKIDEHPRERWDAPFIRAVLARPDEDWPRLVYADALEERGECERAEFLRVQIELAKLKPPSECDRTFCDGSLVVCPDCRRWKPLSRRERELLGEHFNEWHWPLRIDECYSEQLYPNPEPPHAKIGVTFRGGLVHEITLDWPTWGGGVCQARCRNGSIETRMGNKGGSLISICPVCRGSGRTPGHATAILAAQPVRKVKLTSESTMEAGIRDGCLCYSDCDGQHQGPKIDYEKPCGRFDLLKMALAHQAVRLGAAPGIEFELPPVRGLTAMPAEYIVEFNGVRRLHFNGDNEWVGFGGTVLRVHSGDDVELTIEGAVYRGRHWQPFGVNQLIRVTVGLVNYPMHLTVRPV